MTLRARLPVLYRSRQYSAGDILPATDDMLVAAWIESGAAFWDEVDIHKKAVKVQAVSAEPGLPGRSSDGDPAALVGKASKTPQRRRTGKK